LIAFLFLKIFWAPVRFFVRIFFYSFIVKFYKVYLSVAKKIGLRNREGNLYSFLAQKSLHIVVVIITLTLVFTSSISKTKADPLTDIASKTILSQLVESEFSSVEEEELVEEFFDQEAMISPVQQKYLDNLASFRSQPSVLVDSLGEALDDAGESVIGGGALVKHDGVGTTITKQLRSDIAYHEVKPGESISTIAEDYEVSVSTILWENNLSAYSVIRPGDKLAILPINGVSYKVKSGDNLTKIAANYKVDEKDIQTINKLYDASKLAVGQIIIIPGGRKESYTAPAQQRYSGVSAIMDFVKAPNATPVDDNKMNWPTEGYRITQYYSWKHTGLDIANKIGTPLYAADAGVVEVLGWGTGYGNQIVIDHGGGKKTRYAHLSKFYVEKGDKVEKGETVGAMGSTGWSTGSHIHFEVIINGVKYNPLNYIK
jgi:LysM repeat protein